jgi:hypothetical protein
MRPKISSCKKIASTLRYNEQKVQQGQAECLLAANFIKDAARLSFDDKLARFRRLMQLNDRITTSNLHISLNFHPSEKLSDEKMKEIARVYMQEIGFGQQPYLVYRHHDAGHPHMHIVSTHIRPDGSPIPLYNIGRNQSEKAKQQIELRFGLLSSENRERVQRQKIVRGMGPRNITKGVQRVSYGASPIAPAISAVLESVTEQYKFTSLEEFNAILRLYNVEACRGKEQSQSFKHRGLLYRVLDKQGNYVGVPLKASFFDCRPTLANLEKKFILNQSLRLQHQQNTTTRILWAKIQGPAGLTALQRKLEKEQISMVLEKDTRGGIRQVNYVDFRSKCVFNSEDLDKRCGLEEIQRLAAHEQLRQQQESLSEEHEQSQRHSLRHHL